MIKRGMKVPRDESKKKKEKSNDQWDEVIHNDINAFHTCGKNIECPMR